MGYLFFSLEFVFHFYLYFKFVSINTVVRLINLFCSFGIDQIWKIYQFKSSTHLAGTLETNKMKNKNAWNWITWCNNFFFMINDNCRTSHQLILGLKVGYVLVRWADIFEKQIVLIGVTTEKVYVFGYFFVLLLLLLLLYML